MIPSVLGPNIRFICEESMAESLFVPAEVQRDADLDPKGGISLAMSWTEEVIFGFALSISFLS